MARKTFDSVEEELVSSVFSDDEIKKILEENKRLKSGIKVEEDITNKTLVGYEIVLSKANSKYQNQKYIDFGTNGKIFRVEFGVPSFVDPAVIDNLRNHQDQPHKQNIHYHFSIVRAIYK